MLRRRRLGGQPGGRDHRHAQRVVGAELDPVERVVDRGARAPRRRPRASASSAWSAPSTPRYCGSRESTASSAARARCAARRVALVARRARARRGAGRRRAPTLPPDAPARGRRPRSAASAASQSPASNAACAIASESQTCRVGSDGDLGVRLARDGERLLRAADQVQRVGQVHAPRRRRPAGARARARARARAAAPRALLDLAGRHQRDAERVERPDARRAR